MSPKMKRTHALLLGLSAILLLCGSILLGTGCNKSTLAPGGAYNPITVTAGVTNSAPDLDLFIADSAYQVAYNTIDAAFTTEKNNRALLWKTSPSIKHTLDSIRPQALDANDRYLSARAAYITNPVPDNLQGVNKILAEIQQIAIAAQAALPKGK